MSTNNFLCDATMFHSLATCFGHLRLSLAILSSKLQNVQTCSATLSSDPRFSFYHIVIECAVQYFKVLSCSNYMIRQNWDPSVALLPCIFLYFFNFWYLNLRTKGVSLMGKVGRCVGLTILLPSCAVCVEIR
jgi:hypothetical protein